MTLQQDWALVLRGHAWVISLFQYVSAYSPKRMDAHTNATWYACTLTPERPQFPKEATYRNLELTDSVTFTTVFPNEPRE